MQEKIGPEYNAGGAQKSCNVADVRRSLQISLEDQKEKGEVRGILNGRMCVGQGHKN